MFPISPRFFSQSVALALTLTTLTVGCGGGARLAKFDIRRTTTETRVAETPANPSSPSSPSNPVELPTEAPLPEGSNATSVPPSVNHSSPIGQVDMIDLIAAVSRQAHRQLEFAASAVASGDEDRACGRLAQLVGSTEMAERMRQGFPGTRSTDSQTPGVAIAYWDFMTRPLMQQAHTAFTQYCSSSSSNHYSDSYFSSLTASSDHNSLAFQIDSRISGITGNWNQLDIPLWDNSGTTNNEISNTRLILELVMIRNYLPQEPTTTLNAVEACGAVSKMLGGFDVWFDVMTDTRGGGTLEQMNQLLVQPAENTALARIDRQSRSVFTRVLNTLVSLRDRTCGGSAPSDLAAQIQSLNDDLGLTVVDQLQTSFPGVLR